MISQRRFLDSIGEIDRLELISTRIRKNSMEMVTKSKTGHTGGSLSVADILTCLYFGRTYDPETGLWDSIMHYDPLEPLWLNRDRLVLSKGHAAPAFYAALAEAGFFSDDLLKIYRKIESPLEGHPAMYRVFNENGKTVRAWNKGGRFQYGIFGTWSIGWRGHGASCESVRV